jgi:predicted SAM-dependent methyltransferase
MSEAHMQRVNAVFNTLKPVTWHETGHLDIPLPFTRYEVESWQKRCRLGTKIGKDHPPYFLHWIRELMNALFEPAPNGLPGDL